MFYDWLVYLHILSILLFMAAHGVAVIGIFQIKRARSVEAVIGVLDVSAASLGLMYVTLVALLATGVALGIMGDHWRSGWFWASLAVLVLIVAAMVPLGAIPFSNLRRTAGIPYSIHGKLFPAEPAKPEEVMQLIARLRPELLTAVGILGLALVLYLMMFKPF